MKSMWHFDIDYKTPDGKLGMEQTLSYFEKSSAISEAVSIIRGLRRKGCTDIIDRLREIRIPDLYDASDISAIRPCLREDEEIGNTKTH